MVEPAATASAPPHTGNGTLGKVLNAALSVVVACLLLVGDKLWSEKEKLDDDLGEATEELSGLRSTVDAMREADHHHRETVQELQTRLGQVEVAAGRMQERLEGVRDRLQRLYEQLLQLDTSLQREMRDRDEIGSVELDGLGRRLQDEIAARERLMLETIRGLANELREALRGLEREVFPDGERPNSGP